VTGNPKRGFVVSILKDGEFAKVTSGEYRVTGKKPDGSILVAPAPHGNVLAVPNSQWRVSTHDATQYGSRMLTEAILPGRSFPFPKSLYAVEDALRFFLVGKPEAIVLDFFSGSGTTTHALARLNREDGGRRRSIVVTNNEVDEATGKELLAKGHEAGISEEFERNGICRAITWPRIKACVTGTRPDGDPIPGSYLDGRPMAEGFEENAAYFKLDFLDPDEVSRGEQFEAVVPILWMLAGSIGACSSSKGTGKWILPTGNRFAVLLKEDCFGGFRQELAKRDDITHVFLVTDSTEAFNDMAAVLGGHYSSLQLYRSYIDTFRINLGEPGTRGALDYEPMPTFAERGA
jgi:adenine-specific DNA-methyltransferase